MNSSNLAESTRRCILDALGPDLFAGLLTPEGILLEANAPVLLATGLRPETAIGTGFAELDCWAHSHAVRQDLRVAIERAAAGTPSRYDVQLRVEDGNLIWIDFSLRAVRDERGTVIYLVPSAVTIDERKRAEEALRESELRFRQLAESIDEVFWLRDVATGETLYVSPGYERIWGQTCDELYAAPGGWLDAVHADDRPGIDAKLLQLRREGSYNEQYRILRPDGSIRWIHDQAFPIRDGDGRIYRHAGIARDITERKFAAEEQARFESRLHQTQKLRALGTLAGGIAHDFNNILAIVNGFATLAARELPAAHPTQEHLATIARAAGRGTDLVRQIMTYCRPPSGARRMVGQLRPVIEDALKLIRATLPAMIEIRTEFAAAVPPVEMDAGQIHQIVMNLTTNAAHAIGETTGCIELSIGSQTLDDATVTSLSPDLHAGQYTCLSVRDTGSGMDAATLSRIFEPFFTTKKVDEGTGLGLSVVYGIMKGHGGAIIANSRPGAGTAFHLYFPSASMAVNGGPAVTMRKSEPRGAGEHVLYVDDDESMATLMLEVLGRLGYRVSAFSDPLKALLAFRSDPSDYHLVVTDLSMPAMSGADLARELQRIRADIPILMTSGYVREEDEASARSMGLHHVILKPDSVFEMGRIVHEILCEHRVCA